MRILLRKLRAALAIGSLWGMAIGAAGAFLGGLLSTTSAPALGLVGGAIGLVLGTGFGGLLSVMEGRRTLDELTPRRAAIWGFLVGAVVAVAGALAVAGITGLGLAAGNLGLHAGLQLVAVGTAALSYGAITAGLAAGTVAIAQGSPTAQTPEFPGSDEPRPLLPEDAG